MKKRSWVRRLFTHTIHKAPRRGRPTVEVLEDRCVPSTFIVTNTGDALTHGAPTRGTLRWAIGQANSTAGANTIAFAESVFTTHKTITLSHSALELSNTAGLETITGPAAGVTVSGGPQVFAVAGLVTASISGLTISGGADYGGVGNFGTLTLSNCTISHNGSAGYFALGGGLVNRGTATLIDCTVSDNSVSGVYGASGAGVYNFGQGTLTMTNCTISGNSAYAASASGGGLENSGTATLTNCTISGNVGGGLSNGGTATLANTIVARNDSDVTGAVTSEGNNLIGSAHGSSGWISSDRRGTRTHPLNPVLASLGNYGGPTETMALLPGSPAIDAGNNALLPPGVSTDQRGLPRSNGHVDIGAFESSGFTISVTSGSGQSTGVLTGFSAPLVVTVTANNPSEPVSWGLVTFTPPASGASATLTGSPATFSGDGVASITATANGSAGSYIVSARARGIKTPAKFSLTNTSSLITPDPSASGVLSLGGNARITIAGVVHVDSRSSFVRSPSRNARASGADIFVLGDGRISKLTAEPAWAGVDGFFADAALEHLSST
jgi:hypothetical protein